MAKSANTKQRGPGSTDGSEVPIEHRQLQLSNGEWQPKVPAAVKKHLREYDTLDDQIKALTKKRNAAKQNVIAAAEKAGCIKIRIGDEYAVIADGAKTIKREKIKQPKKKATRKKAAVAGNGKR